jgi:hypothetical protein
VRDGVATPVHRARDVDVQGAVDDLVRDLVEDAGEVDAGIVEGDVDPAPALRGAVRVGPDRAWVD